MTQNEQFADLEREVGVPKGFFDALLKEDDWSFVIKLHAFFEAACTHLLLFHFQEPALAQVVARLELSNKTTGKIAFLGALQLVGRRPRRFISALSELRNSLVHDVRHHEFHLAGWFASLEPDKQRSVAISFSPYETFLRDGPHLPGWAPDRETQRRASLEAVLDRARTQTKQHVWVGAHSVLISMMDMKGYSEYRQWAKAEALLGDDEEDAG